MEGWRLCVAAAPGMGALEATLGEGAREHEPHLCQGSRDSRLLGSLLGADRHALTFPWGIRQVAESTQYIYGVLSAEVAAVIEGFTPRLVSSEAARFAKEVTAAARPESVKRARAFLFCTSRLAAYGQQVGLALTPEALVCHSVIERMCTPGVVLMSAPTRRTVRTNLRAVVRQVAPRTASPAPLSRERSKWPYSQEQIAGYLSLADAQPTRRRQMRAGALVCLGAGAGLMGSDLRGVRGSDVARRFGAVVVSVAGRRPRVVPVRARFAERLLSAADFAKEGLLIGGVDPDRNNVTTKLTASLAGGADLERIDIGRLRATWLCEVAGAIGLKAFMDAAGVTCSQRLGDLVARLEPVGEAEAVVMLGGRR